MRALKYAGRLRDCERGRTLPSPSRSAAEPQFQNKSSEWTTGVTDEFPTIFRLFFSLLFAAAFDHLPLWQ